MSNSRYIITLRGPVVRMVFVCYSNGNRTALVSAFVVVCGKRLGIHDEWQVSTRKTERMYELPIGNFP